MDIETPAMSSNIGKQHNFRKSVLRMVIGSVCAILILAGCSHYPKAPEKYTVRSGDTLSGIARQYGLTVKEIKDWNALRSAHKILVGQVLHLRPGKKISSSSGKSRSIARKTTPKKSTGRSVARHTPSPTLSSGSKKHWSWPIQGKLAHRYNPNIPGRKGIKINGYFGQPVKAASSGKVIYRGTGLPGYGRLLIVKHNNGTLSAYGYLGRILVREGQTVKKGQSIAELGMSTDNRSVLHFEIRRNGKPVNPMLYLPS